MERLGNYRLRKRLAVGGMAEVYLGEKVGPEGFVKPVVLKCVLPQLAKDRAFVQLFLDEARLAALLHHPNIAQVYDFGSVDGVYHIAMEYVPGYTLDDIRRKLRSIGQLMPLQHVANVASQTCQGLSYAHRLTDARGESFGLVHRDVSPHNLIVSVDGTVKIVDFGIAKARAGLTRVQARGAVGKFGYMSPEQALGKVVDGRSDLFSLGVCLWELTTTHRLHDPGLGRPPDYDPSRPIRSVETLREEVPRQFTEIIESALAIEPEDRFASAQAMHMAFERFQAAMTHYAGQTALAGFIRDLVEGRTGTLGPSELVQPAEPSGPSDSSGRDGLEEAQRYEEVFGVTLERPRGRPLVRSVPKAWQARPAPTTSSDGPNRAAPGAPPSSFEDSSTTLVPELAWTPATGSRMAKSTQPTRPRKSRLRRGPLIAVALLGVLAGLTLGYRDQLGRMMAPRQDSVSTLTSLVRIESKPSGARVRLDGEVLVGRTPLQTELIPDVDYVVEVSMDGYATAHRRVAGRVTDHVQNVRFDLEPAAILEVVSAPAGAFITVDGRRVRGVTTPAVMDDVPADRPIQVRLELDSGPTAVRTVTVPAATRRKLRFALD
ncbi:MAG: serine/threonine protein kinase [Myxococcota bacterium]